MDGLTIIGVTTIWENLKTIWSWSVVVWEFMHARPWIGTLLIVVGVTGRIWLTRRMKRQEAERKRLEEVAEREKERLAKEAARAAEHREARDRAWKLAQNVQASWKRIDESWGEVSPETWKAFKDQVDELHGALLDLPRRESESWLRIAREFWTTISFASDEALGVEVEAGDRRERVRLCGQNIFGIAQQELAEVIRRFPGDVIKP